MSPTRLLLVALPLLAVALLAPSAAFAASPCGGTSAEITYCPEVPTIESGGTPKNHGKPPATNGHSEPGTAPKTEGQPVETTTEPGTESQTGEGHGSKVAPPTKGGNHPGGGKPSDGIAGGHAVADPGSSGKNVTAKSEGPTTKGVPASASSGGSSPVLPILVAIVILAAISIGVVVYRNRKGGDGQAGYTGARG
jgi:hypothetical protein